MVAAMALVWSSVLLTWPPGGIEPTGLEAAALWIVIPLAVFFATFTFIVATTPYFERGWQGPQQASSATQRKIRRALRRREPIAPGQEAFARFVISQQRAGTRFMGWLGLMYASQIVLSAGQAPWRTATWLALAAVWLGVMVFVVRAERSYRLWESGRRSADGAG